MVFVFLRFSRCFGVCANLFQASSKTSCYNLRWTLGSAPLIVDSARKFKNFQDFSGFFKIFQNVFKILEQILVYLPGRSGPSTRAVGPGTNFGVFPRSLGA